MSLEHMGDVKAATIAEWVVIDVVRRAIQKHFKSFLMTYTDENGHSVYGQRIKHLGESKSSPLMTITNADIQSTPNPSKSRIST
jgi:DNA replication licensing factor MCM2